MAGISRIITTCCLLAAFSLHAEPLYWQASKGNLQLTIFGSIHVGEPKMYPLPQPVYQALQDADGLIVEADIRNNQHIRYPYGQPSAEQVLSDEQVFMLDKVVKDLGQDAEVFRQLAPWKAALSIQLMQLQQLGFHPTQGVDAVLMDQAIKTNKPIVALESVQFQVDLLTKQPDAGQEMLTALLEDWEKNQAMTECMIDSWIAGDVDNLNSMAQLTEMSPELEQAMVQNRNRDWADKLASGQLLPQSQGQYLMVVGTLHLVGQDNLLSMLQQRGFTVHKLNHSQTADCQFY